MPEEKNNNPERNIFDELSKVTEKKIPTADVPKSFSWVDESENANILPEKPKAEKKEAVNDQDGEKNLTPEQMQDAAEASAAGVELITSLISEAAINLTYYFKMPSDHRKELDETILDKPKAHLDEAEMLILNRYERLMNSRDKKLEKIAMSDKARERLEKSFYRYSESTGKVFLTPKSELAICITESVLKTVIAVVIE